MIRSHRADHVASYSEQARASRQIRRLHAIVALLSLALATTAGALFASPAPARPDTTPVAETLPLLSTPEEIFAWCQAHNTQAFRARLNADGRTVIRGCANIGDVLASTSPTPTPSPTVSPTSSPSPSPTTPAPSPTTPPPSPTPSPTPTPSPSPTTPPSRWPGPDNTGVPPGTTLSVYTGPCTILGPTPAIIDAKLISCDLDIRGPATITRSSIGGLVNINSAGGTTLRLSISDSVIDAGHRLATGLGDGLFDAQRVEVRGGNRGVLCAWRCTLQDSWVHGTYVQDDWHASAVRAERYSTIVHNTLACDWLIPTALDGGCSADLTGYPDFTSPHDWLIQNNLFIANPTGAAFCAYGGSSPGKPFSSDPLTGTNIQFIGNTFQRGTVPGDKGLFRCAFYGAVDAFAAGKPGAVWSGNVYDDGTLILP